MTLQLGLLSFWGVWHGLVFLTNLCEGMKVAEILPSRWKFASKNYEAIVRVTVKYRPARWVHRSLFLAVLLWQLVIVIAFASAIVASIQLGGIDQARTTMAFTLSLGLFSAFMLADEVCLEYDTEHVHILFFIAQLVTVIGFAVLPS